jgi:hypothetical protein
MIANQNITRTLNLVTPQVRRNVEQFIHKPTERNACYVTGYLVAACEAGALLAEHRTVLVQWIANTEHAAKVPPLTEGERSLWRWRNLGAGGFEKSLWSTIMAADGTNLEMLGRAFPQHVAAYRRYAYETGYWTDLQARIEGERS